MSTPEKSTETKNQATPESTETENQEAPKSTETENQEPAQSTETKNQVVYDDGEEEGVTDQAPETPETPETSEVKVEEKKEDDGGINQEKVNKKINKLTFEKFEERRKREALEKEHEKTLAELKKLKGEDDEIVIPPLPDAYDPNYETKLAERDQALQEKAKKAAEIELTKQREQDELKRKQDAAREVYITKANTMFEAGEKMGISKEEMQKAEGVVTTFIHQPELAQFILDQEDSALIVNHLANNIDELAEIGQMSPIRASAYIATHVVPAAQKFKPAVSNTPDPLEIPKGKAAGNEDPYMKGVTLE